MTNNPLLDNLDKSDRVSSTGLIFRWVETPLEGGSRGWALFDPEEDTLGESRLPTLEDVEKHWASPIVKVEFDAKENDTK